MQNNRRIFWLVIVLVIALGVAGGVTLYRQSKPSATPNPSSTKTAEEQFREAEKNVITVTSPENIVVGVIKKIDHQSMLTLVMVAKAGTAETPPVIEERVIDASQTKAYRLVMKSEDQLARENVEAVMRSVDNPDAQESAPVSLPYIKQEISLAELPVGAQVTVTGDVAGRESLTATEIALEPKVSPAVTQ